jgi:hypothetical protein
MPDRQLPCDIIPCWTSDWLSRPNSSSRNRSTSFLLAAPGAALQPAFSHKQHKPHMSMSPHMRDAPTQIDRQANQRPADVSIEAQGNMGRTAECNMCAVHSSAVTPMRVAVTRLRGAAHSGCDIQVMCATSLPRSSRPTSRAEVEMHIVVQTAVVQVVNGLANPSTRSMRQCRSQPPP